MLKRFARWLLRNEPTIALEPPMVVHLALHPYTQGVQRKDYLAAWDQVAQLKEGQLIIRTLHNHLVAALEERCPEGCVTAESRGLWLAGHDARKKVWMDLTLAAVKGTRLSQEITIKRAPQLVAGGAMET
jgi:hypothetical protein